MSCSQGDFFTEEDYYDLCGDEPIWSIASYGEAGAGVTSRLRYKLVMTK